MAGKAQRQFCIYAVLSNDIKAGRDRFSGVLRFASETDDWQVRQIRSESILADLPHDGLSNQKVDGIISYHTKMLDHLLSDDLCRISVPVVWMDNLSQIDSLQFPVCAEVRLNDSELSYAAADLLMKRGLTNFAYVGFSGGEFARSQLRERFFRERVERAGFSCSCFCPSATDEEFWMEELQRLADWLAELPKPCGVMAYCDQCAKQVYDACRIARLLIPDQLRIVGVDNDIAICENLSPTLTSVEPDFEGCGYLAARLLDDFLRRKSRTRLKPISYGVRTVAERASTQDVKGGGRIVTAAREIIRLNVCEPITVASIADQLHVSYRLLELRFRDVLGISVGEEIRRVRLENVCRLLRTTDHSIGEICERSGFDSTSHLSSLFKKSYGITMRQYRRVRLAPAGRW